MGRLSRLGKKGGYKMNFLIHYTPIIIINLAIYFHTKNIDGIDGRIALFGWFFLSVIFLLGFSAGRND